MSARSSLRGACRALALRSKPFVPRQEGFITSAIQRRHNSNQSTTPPSKQANSPLENALNSLKAEAEASKSSTSSPVSQTAEGSSSDNDAVLAKLKDLAGLNSTPPIEGGLTPSQEEALYREGRIPDSTESNALRDLELATGLASEEYTEVSEAGEGHKFALPKLPLPPQSHLKQRYHPVVHQLTNLLMRHGKLGAAQRNMAMILNYLRTSPAPILNPKHPLLAGSPPASHLPYNPVLYLTLAIDSVAPIIFIRKLKGGAGGGTALEIPLPLKVRQRRRIAFQWILDVVNKKPSKGSGKGQFPRRVAEEIVAVAEGRSSVWDKRQTVHKIGTAARVNVKSLGRKVKKRAGK